MAGFWDRRQTSSLRNANGYLGRFPVHGDLLRRLPLPPVDGEDQPLGNPDNPKSSDWVGGEDETLISYVADWEDPYDMTFLEDGDSVSWYVNDGNGSWEEVPSPTPRLSEEIIHKNLKTRLPHRNDNQEICVVCQECLFQVEEYEIAVLECQHEYHVKCIKNWLMKKNCCPLCKAKGISVN